MNASDTQHVDHLQRILEERALALAKPPRDEIDQGTIDVLTVRVGTESYGIDIDHLTEVRPPVDVTPVPDLPPIWAGLTNLRGVLYPVLDMARYLGSESTAEGDRVLLLVSSATLTVGLLADEIVGLRSVVPAEVESPLETDTDAARGLVSGITPDFLLLLDMEVLLGDARLVVEEEAF
jgi:purine-binding chemotaxis protein CheW